MQKKYKKMKAILVFKLQERILFQVTKIVITSAN